MCKLFLPLLAALALPFSPPQSMASNEGGPPPRPDTQRTTPLARLPDSITTLDGKTYEKVILDRVHPDGLLVRFAPGGGGAGVAKLKFRNLPSDLRDQYGYDATRAADYENAQARSEAMWLNENAAWVEARRAAQAEHAAWERQMRVDAESRRAAAEESAAAARYSAGHSGPYPWWSPGISGYGFGFPERGFPGHGFDKKDFGGSGFHHHRFERGKQPLPGNGPFHPEGLGIRKSHVSPHLGPMNPAGK